MQHFIPAVMYNGQRGVQLFYLLSAFTLFMSFNYRSTKERSPTTNYFIRRFFRIAPLYYLAVIYYLWQDGTGPRFWLGSEKSITTLNIASNFSFTHGFNPYWINSIVQGGWSVGVEVAFYCLLPFLFLRIKNIQQACNFVFISLFIRVLLMILLTHYRLIPDEELWGQYLFFYLPNQLPIFAMGIVLYFLIYDSSNLKISSKSLFIYAIALIVGLAIQSNLFIPEICYYGVFFLMLALALHKYHPRILFNPFLLYVGKISYTLYLTHFAVIYFLGKVKLLNLITSYNQSSSLLNFVLNYLIVLLISICLSTILYYTIEDPMQKLGAKLIRYKDKQNKNMQVIA
jgi:peptidoglycan/LPS O-acetylase OafA/YrhL